MLFYMAAKNAPGYLTYNLSYIELYPEFICMPEDGPEYECSHDDICDNGTVLVDFRVDWSKATSLHNWVEELDLYCVSNFKISLFGSLFFLGFFISSLFVSRFADVYGRKPFFVWSGVLQLIAYSIAIFVVDLSARYAMLFFLGLALGIRTASEFPLFAELTPNSRQAFLFTVFNVFDGLNVAFSSIYFYWISKEWVYTITSD